MAREKMNEAGGEIRRLISIEGGDGAGKSTVARCLYERLVIANAPVLLVQPKHPEFLHDYIQKFMAALEKVLRGPRHLLSDHHWVSLTSAWYQIINEYLVRPALERREIVILDSWYHKPLARFRLQNKEIFAEAQNCFRSLEKPEAVFLLDIDPELAADRKSEFGFGETGNFEQRRDMNRQNFVSYQHRTRQMLRTMAAEEEWQIIEVDRLGPEGVVEQILTRLKERELV